MGLFMDSTGGGIYLFIVSETVNYPIRRSLSARRQIVTQGGQISSPLWTKLINMVLLPLPIPHLLRIYQSNAMKDTPGYQFPSILVRLALLRPLRRPLMMSLI